MIFLTVGTDMPFDRLVRVVDAWAAENHRRDVFAQIGKATFLPTFIEYAEFLDPPDFNHRFASASVIVAHAGMGTILSALRYRKPILVMPRRASLGEQRNEHQLATARRLLELGKINVAFDELELQARLADLDSLKTRDTTEAHAGPELISALQAFIHQTPR